MTPEEKSLLERTHKLVEENNSMLHSLRRSSRFSLIFKIVYWSIIIGLSIGAFYVIQPYVESVMGLYDQVQGDSATIHAGTNFFKDMFK